ncbi:uncharacterized protein LOC117124849 [Anneissia japonica]|uniref:uncharacterized protein LOC117124849 n=1 Tax=Anneissia japonica TaxID=1529436 RepID=UPI001425ADB0|nr:uncharacterized protein LOC117124849 [Anneissia japonica]
MLALKYFTRVFFLILLDYFVFECDNYCAGQVNYRDDHRCGAGFPAPDGEDAICLRACCSPWHWCGLTDDYCCSNCVDYRQVNPTESCTRTALSTLCLPPGEQSEPVGLTSAVYNKLIGKCLAESSGSEMQISTRSSNRCARACLAYNSKCNAFGFDQRFSKNFDCFLYNTTDTSWKLEDVGIIASNDGPKCSFYVKSYK